MMSPLVNPMMHQKVALKTSLLVPAVVSHPLGRTLIVGVLVDAFFRQQATAGKGFTSPLIAAAAPHLRGWMLVMGFLVCLSPRQKVAPKMDLTFLRVLAMTYHLRW